MLSIVVDISVKNIRRFVVLCERYIGGHFVQVTHNISVPQGGGLISVTGADTQLKRLLPTNSANNKS